MWALGKALYFSCRYCCSEVLILIIWKWFKCPHILTTVLNTAQVRIFLTRKTSLVPWIHYVIDWFYTSILKTLCRTQCVNCSFADTELRMRLAGSCACSIVCGQAGVLKFSLGYCIYVSLFQWKLLKFLIRFPIKCCWMYSSFGCEEYVGYGVNLQPSFSRIYTCHL